MKDYTPDKIRNLALVGHGSSGKTSLAAALLFDFGATGRLTKVDKGNTVTDYEPEEIDRKISINSAVCFFETSEFMINCVDTPVTVLLGHAGRAGGRRRGGPGRRGSGVEVGTKMWECSKTGFPADRHQQARP
jgi:elongation factor G